MELDSSLESSRIIKGRGFTFLFICPYCERRLRSMLEEGNKSPGLWPATRFNRVFKSRVIVFYGFRCYTRYSLREEYSCRMYDLAM